jgi:hypothetical protein
MSASLSRARGLFPVLLILAALAYWWLHPSPPKVLAIGYIADRSDFLWNTPAQVREQVAELHYGDRVEIIQQEGTAAQVRSPAGVLGWLLDTRQIMDSALWQEAADLLARARTLPVQARGLTKTVSNVRIEPGRNARRVFQFMRGTPVVVLERTVADATQVSEEASPENSNPGDQDRKAKKEDWLLVLRTDGPEAVTGSSSAESHPAAPGGSGTSGPISGGAGTARNSASGGASPPIAGWVNILSRARAEEKANRATSQCCVFTRGERRARGTRLPMLRTNFAAACRFVFHPPRQGQSFALWNPAKTLRREFTPCVRQ